MLFGRGGNGEDRPETARDQAARKQSYNDVGTFSALAGFDRIFSAVHKNSVATESPMKRMITEMSCANIDLKQGANPAKLLSISR